MIGICSACKEPCTVKIIDNGIGSYEYWGAKGRDIQLEAVSDCCEAPAYYKDLEGFITIKDIKEEEYDRFYR